MRNYRILLLMNKYLVPPENIEAKKFDRFKELWTTEFDVLSTLKELGHQVLPLGIWDNLGEIDKAVRDFKPHLIFNLLDDYGGNPQLDKNIVGHLELLGIPYTGCNPKGLLLSRQKDLAKSLLKFHDVPTPDFWIFPKNKYISTHSLPAEYPLFVKSLTEEASLGISKASIIKNQGQLIKRIEFIHKNISTDALVEKFIPGREFFVGVLGNKKVEALPILELSYSNVENAKNEIYSDRAKFNQNYRKRKGIGLKKAELSDFESHRIKSICKKAYQALGLSGYARIDLRYTEDKKIYLLEINPNPDVSLDDEFAIGASLAKFNYKDLLKKIIGLGLGWKKLKQA